MRPADRRLRDIQRPHDLPTHLEHLLALFPGHVGIELDPLRGGQHLSRKVFGIFTGLLVRFSIGMVLGEIPVGIAVGRNGQADRGGDEAIPLVQVGVRSISPEEIELIDKTPRIKTFFAASIVDPSGPYEGRAARWIPDVVKACTGPVYLTFDCDGLDASLVPALGTPEPGGLGWYDTLALVTALANGPGIVGMDISEIAPIEGFVAPQFSIARLIYRMLGRIRAGRRVH